MQGGDTSDNTSQYIVNIRWVFEGILLPTIGCVGILGKYCCHHLPLEQENK